MTIERDKGGVSVDTSKIAYGGLVLMLTIIGWMAVAGLDNNTKAMDRLVDALGRIEKRIGTHDILLENHEVRLEKAGL